MRTARFIPIFGTVLLSFASLSVPATDMWLEAGLNAVGDPFSVDVYIRDASDLYGLSFSVSYSTDSVTVVDGDLDPTNGVFPVLLDGYVLGEGGAVFTLMAGGLDRRQLDRLVVGHSRAGQVAGVDIVGDGLLMSFLLSRDRDAVVELAIEDAHLEDGTSQPISVNILPTVIYRSTGTVVVDVTPDSASWSFADGDAEIHTGTGDATVTAVPTGDVTLTWETLAEHDPPTTNPETKTLLEGETITFTGIYTIWPKAASPEISPADGTYPAPITITMSCATPEATIRYTTDGTEPNESSPVYPGTPIQITGNPGASKTVRAKAFKTHHRASDTTVATYTFELPPMIACDPTSLTQRCAEGQGVTSQTFQVWNAGGQTLYYTLETTPTGLLHVEPPAGISTGLAQTHTAFFDAAGLSAGDYAATITISDPSAVNNPQQVSALLHVSPWDHLHVGDGTGDPGDVHCPVAISLDNATTVSSVTFDLTDIPDWLTVGDVQITSRSIGFTPSFEDGGVTATIRLDSSGSRIAPGEGPICVVYCDVDGSMPNGTTISLTVDPGTVLAVDTTGLPLYIRTHGGVFLPRNAPPEANAGGPYLVREGDAVGVSASGNDPDGDPLTFAWDLDNDGTFETPGQSAVFQAVDGPRQITVTVRVTDTGGLSATDQAIIEVLNVASAVGQITAPVNAVSVKTVVNASADFSDPGVLDTHTAVWDWGDGQRTIGSVVETNGSGSVSGSHTYPGPGVYSIGLMVTDKDGDSGESVFQYVVVYDASGGFVTGGGWIDSPPGAYAADPFLTGKANFGFVSKYRKGTEIPQGQTQFDFHVADLNFHSTSYQWLVIAGPHVKFKGAGTINNNGDYGFILTARDGQASGGGGVDRFRIRIWDKTTDETVYDNQMGDDDDGEATDAIEGGSIVIHKAR